MPESPDKPFDVYADTYQVSTNPWGVTINFMLSDPMPVAPGTPPKVANVGHLRLSLENLKVLVFLMHRQVKQHEQNLGVNIQIPRQVLNALQISVEDWRPFWGEPGEGR